MGYLENTLMPGEELKYKTGISWIAAFGTPGGSLIAAAAAFKVPPLSAICLLVSVLSFPFALINYKTSVFAVTNKRVLIKTGFLRRRSLEILLTKLEAINLDQGILDRANNMGTIVIVGSGGTRERFKDMDRPLEFRKQVQIQADLLQSAKGAAA